MVGPPPLPSPPEDVIRGLFASAGCTGTLAALPVDGPAAGVPRVSVDADRPVVSASVVKVSIALAALTAFHDGCLDPNEAVDMPAAARTPGPTGLSSSPLDARATLGELVGPALVVSDNEAADVLLGSTGIAAVNELTRRLGLPASVVVSDLRTMISSLAADTGFADWAEMTAWADADQPPAQRAAFLRRLVAARALDPATATRTTAGETARLLRMVWRDEAGPPSACARVRVLMARQLSRARLASGFPSGEGRPSDAAVRIAAKSGSLVGVVRNEAGVLTDPDGRSFVVAVFTVANRPYERATDVDTAIGAAAATAVDHLRTLLSNRRRRRRRGVDGSDGTPVVSREEGVGPEPCHGFTAAPGGREVTSSSTGTAGTAPRR